MKRIFGAFLSVVAVALFPLKGTAQYRYIAPVNGWSNAWVEMSNRNWTFDANVTLTIYNRNGVPQRSIDTTIPDQGYLRTWDILPERNIYNIAKPAVVLVESDRELGVACGRWHRSAGAGFAVPEEGVAEGRVFMFPISGWSSTWVEMVNTSTGVANVLVYVYDAAGNYMDGADRDIPPMGYLSTKDMVGDPLDNLDDGNLYNIAKPLSIYIESTRDIVVTNVRYSPSSAWGFFVPPNEE